MRKLIHEEILQSRLTTEQALTAERFPVAAILEDIRSLYNVGSCFRTADAMLLDKLILTGYTPMPPRREIAKTALGATESVPWEFIADPAEAAARLKSQGYALYALEITEESVPLDRLDGLRFPLAFVAGNEIAGVGEPTLAQCDGAIEIPMFGVKHSLNVAVAFGIAAWELTKLARARSDGD